MLNKIRIVVFRGLKLRPEAHISMLLPSNRRIRTYLGRRGHQSLAREHQVPQTEQRNSCASFLARPR